MTFADISLGAFAFFSLLRLIAYLPQIVKIARDTTGAQAISNTTWMLFAVSHLATALYAIVALKDAVIGVVFIANAVCCLIIVALVVRSRLAFAGCTEVSRASRKAVSEETA